MSRLSQKVDNRGGRISGGLFQAGENIIINEAPQEQIAEYESKWTWRSPLTLALLTWISVGLGFFSVVAGWQGITPMFKSGLGSGIPSHGWVYTFLVVLMFFMVALFLRGITKKRTQHFSRWHWLPSLTGSGGRIGLQRLQGTCPECGGPFRFYSKPMERVTDVQTGKQKITRRASVAECDRDPGHCWSVGRTALVRSCG